MFVLCTAVLTGIVCMAYTHLCRSHRVTFKGFPSAPWGAVCLYWSNDFWAAFAASLSAQVQAESFEVVLGNAMIVTILKIGLAAVVTIMLWDMPIKAFKWCSGKRCPWFFHMLCTAWALQVAFHQIHNAFSPAFVALIGHHAIIFGLFNFALNIPKAVIKSRGKVWLRCATRDPHYIPGWYEVVNPMRGLYELNTDTTEILIDQDSLKIAPAESLNTP